MVARRRTRPFTSISTCGRRSSSTCCRMPSSTFEGEIAAAGDATRPLVVRDTGTGIPAAELPQLFQRFHRIVGARGRTIEGSGIGLARAGARPSSWRRRGSGGEEAAARSPYRCRDAVNAASVRPAAGARQLAPSKAYVEETHAFDTDMPEPPSRSARRRHHGHRPRIVLAEDNAMRDYASRSRRSTTSRRQRMVSKAPRAAAAAGPC